MRFSLLLAVLPLLGACAAGSQAASVGSELAVAWEGAAVAASELFSGDSAELSLRYSRAEKRPSYQPDFDYLPVAFAGRMTWVVAAKGDRFPGTATPVITLYGQAGRILRMHGGKLIGVTGYAAGDLQVADNCPFPASLIDRASAVDCVRTYLTRRQGVYMARVRVRQLPPEPVNFRIDDQPVQPGWLVREVLQASGRKGNFYVFDAQRRYVMSRQWLDDASAFDVFALERAE